MEKAIEVHFQSIKIVNSILFVGEMQAIDLCRREIFFLDMCRLFRRLRHEYYTFSLGA